MLIIGVDIAQAKFDVGFWLDKKGTYLGQYSNDPDGFAQFKQSILPRSQADEEIKLILEPTGGYEMGLVFYAQEQGWQVSRPNPKVVKDWAKGSGWRVKNDRQDPCMLAQYGTEKNPPCYQPVPENIQHLNDLVARQVDLQQLLRSERNRLQQYQQRPRSHEAVTNSLNQVIAVLEAQLAAIATAINKLLAADDALQATKRRLLTIPGVGPILVNHLIALLSVWSSQTEGAGTAKQLVAFVGLDPQPFESGRTVFKRPTISKMGASVPRQKLYMGALGGVRGDNPLRAFYQRLVGRGKAKRLALVAAARKILVWAWAVFRKGDLISVPNFL